MKSLVRLLWVTATVAVLVGCASQVTSPVLYVLKAELPPGAVVAPEVRASAAPWQLISPVRVPDYLDREALLLPQGQNGLLASPNQRWAELLSQSVPRLLTQDLVTLGGEGSVWTGSVPRGLAVRGQLRVELLALDVNAAATAVTLKARWTITATDGAAQPLARSHGVTLTAQSMGTDTDSLVSAHRLALWQLAQAIAKTLE
jgi:uncharacterized lipoprotein YmbA